MCSYIKSDVVDFGYKYWFLSISILNYGHEIYLFIDNQKNNTEGNLNEIYSNNDTCHVCVVIDDKNRIEATERILLNELYDMMKDESERCDIQAEYYTNEYKRLNKIMSMQMFRKNKINGLIDLD
jgi:hypothetical protein